MGRNRNTIDEEHQIYRFSRFDAKMNLLHHAKDIVAIALNHRVIFKVFRFLLAELEEWHPSNADGILKRTKRSLLDKTLLNSTQKRFLQLDICLFELFDMQRPSTRTSLARTTQSWDQTQSRWKNAAIRQ